MKPSLFISMGLGFGWFLSAESLLIAGKSVGHLGCLAFPAFSFAVALVLSCNNIICQVGYFSQYDNKLSILLNTWGEIPAVTATIAACLPLLLFAATALLVTAGYTFNEVFLYWFPNFGFAFLLLALLTLLQFLPVRHLYHIQLTFVCLTGLGILILGTIGAITPSQSVTQILPISNANYAGLGFAPLLLLPFAGFDLSIKEKGYQFWIPLLAAGIFLLWMFASLAHLSSAKLAESTISYMIVSRKILGEPGRWIMGTVIISGSCAAITGFTLLLRQHVVTFVKAELVSSFWAGAGQRWVLPIGSSIVIGLLMAKGLAGYDLLETLLKSGLLLWLFYFILLTFTAIRTLKREGQRPSLKSYFAPCILLAGWFTIIVNDPDPIGLIQWMLFVLLASSAVAAGFLYIKIKKEDTP